MIIWVKPTCPEGPRANIRALFDEDSYQMVLVPRDEHAVRGGRDRLEPDPTPNGTGAADELPRSGTRT